MSRVAILFCALIASIAGCRQSTSRTHETLVKEVIFSVQNAATKIEKAEDFDAVSQLETDFHNETAKLRQLKAEFEAMPSPSRWERSRMRKHHQLAEKAFSSWEQLSTELRAEVEAGGVPPHVRIKLIVAIDEFEAVRKDTWNAISARWE